MDLVDEQYVALVEVGEECRQISLLFNGRARRHSQIHPHLGGDDARKGGLTQTGRAIEQYVIQRIVPHTGGLNVDLQIFLGLVLTDVVLHATGTEGDLGLVPRLVGGGDNAVLIVRVAALVGKAEINVKILHGWLSSFTAS